MRCPKCRSLCTEGELVSAVYEKGVELVGVTLDSGIVYIEAYQADKLGLVGFRTWSKREIDTDRSGRRKLRLVETKHGSAWLPTGTAEALGYTEGREIWAEAENSKGICGACAAELRYGKAAHWSRGKAPWNRKVRGTRRG